MKYYLAYGSNLNRTQMRYRCPDAVPLGVTAIKNYTLVFRRGYLTIEPKKGSVVPVAVWQISAQDEKRLDRYEGYPRFYYKQLFEFMDTRTKEYRFAMAYIMADGHPIQRATKEYLRTVRDGYLDFGLDLGPLISADLDAYDKENKMIKC